MRRFEILFPLKYNDNRPIPHGHLKIAVDELVNRFGGVTCERQILDGQWNNMGIRHEDQLVKVFIDIEDSLLNRNWMTEYKDRWKKKLQQKSLWMVTYPIEVECE